MTNQFCTEIVPFYPREAAMSSFCHFSHHLKIGRKKLDFYYIEAYYMHIETKP